MSAACCCLLAYLKVAKRLLDRLTSSRREETASSSTFTLSSPSCCQRKQQLPPFVSVAATAAVVSFLTMERASPADASVAWGGKQQQRKEGVWNVRRGEQQFTLGHTYTIAEQKRTGRPHTTKQLSPTMKGDQNRSDRSSRESFLQASSLSSTSLAAAVSGVAASAARKKSRLQHVPNGRRDAAAAGGGGDGGRDAAAAAGGRRDASAEQAIPAGRTAAGAAGAAGPADAKKESQDCFSPPLNNLGQRGQGRERVERSSRFSKDSSRRREASLRQRKRCRDTETASSSTQRKKMRAAGSNRTFSQSTPEAPDTPNLSSSSCASSSFSASSSASRAAAYSRCSSLCPSVSPLTPAWASSRAKGLSASERSLKQKKQKMFSSESCEFGVIPAASHRRHALHAVLPAAAASAVSSGAAAASPSCGVAVAAPIRAAAARRRGKNADSGSNERKKKQKKKDLQQGHAVMKRTSTSFASSSSPPAAAHIADDDRAPSAAAASPAATPSAAAASAVASEKLFSRYEYTAMAETRLLHQRLVRALLHHQLRRPTAIQQLAIPTVLHGHDVFIQCFTGSGKTLCFAVPLLQQLLAQHERSGKQLKRSDGTRCILLLPTRELAVQVCMQISKIAQLFPWIVVSSITGGEKKQSEKRRLRGGVTVLLCTPGRLLDHLATTSAFSVAYLHLLIFDEADRLLDLGFEKQMRRIFLQLRERQAEEQQQVSSLCSRGGCLRPSAVSPSLLSRPPAHPTVSFEESVSTRDAVSTGDTVSKGDTVFLGDALSGSVGPPSHRGDVSGSGVVSPSLVQSVEETPRNEEEEEETKEKRKGASLGEKEDFERDCLSIRRPEEGFQVIMVSATLTPQVQRLAAFCLHQQPQWVSLSRYQHHLEEPVGVAPASTTPHIQKQQQQQQGRLQHKKQQQQQGREKKQRQQKEERQQRQQTEEEQQQEQESQETWKKSDDYSEVTQKDEKRERELFPCCCMLTPLANQQLSAKEESHMEEEEEGHWTEKKFYDVPEQLQQFYVIVEPRTRFLPLVSFLLQVEKAKGKALIFVSCCDSVGYLHALCSELRWPPPVAPHRRRDQQQLLLLKQQRALQQQHGKRLQHVLAHIEMQKKQQSKRVKKQARFAAAVANSCVQEEERQREGDWPKKTFTGDEEEEEVDDDDDDDGLWGDRVFKRLEFFKLHGKMNKDDRIGYLKEFMEAKSAAVAFATDVAARGLNLPHVNWIVQYDLPQQLEEYVHRIGRTARLGQQGNALLFLLSCERGFAGHLQERGLRLEHRLEEEKMIETLCSSHVPQYLQHISSLPRFLLKQFSTFVSTRPLLLHAARSAFIGTLRSLRALSKASKSVCEHASLHTGHFASSFCLNERPSAAAQQIKRSHSSNPAAAAVYSPASAEEKQRMRHACTHRLPRARAAGPSPPQRRGDDDVLLSNKDPFDSRWRNCFETNRRTSSFSQQERRRGASAGLMQGKKNNKRRAAPFAEKKNKKKESQKDDADVWEIVEEAAKRLQRKGDLLLHERKTKQQAGTSK